MTEAEKAYAAAERLIEEALSWRVVKLDFSVAKTRALSTIPPGIAALEHLNSVSFQKTQISDLRPISGLARITTLNLNDTNVSDLSPIRELTQITSLYLRNTSVTDLSAIKHMSKITKLDLAGSKITDLRNIPKFVPFYWLDISQTRISDLSPLLDIKISKNSTPFLLKITNTPAAISDPRLAEIDAMEDHPERVKTLLTYLADAWRPSAEFETSVPSQDTFLPVEVEDDRLEIAASVPNEAERDERLKAALHERLRPKAEDLARLAGNQYMRLAARARALTTQVDCDFAELDMLLIHLEFADLAELSKIGAEDDLEFTPEIVAALNDVLRLGPGLTLDNPDVELMLERERRLREDPQPQDVQDAHDKLSDEISKNDEIFGDRLRTIEAQNAQMPSVLSADAAQTAVHRNVLLRIWRLTVDTGSISALGISALTFIFAQWPSVFPIVTSYGSFFADWFLAAIGSLPQTPTGLQGLPKQPDDN